MPKSRQPYNFTYKPSFQASDQQNPSGPRAGNNTRAPSLPGGSNSITNNNPPGGTSSNAETVGTGTVRELLTHLRLTQPAAARDDGDGQSNSNFGAPAPTVHPSVQALFGLGQGVPPRPRPRARGFAVPDSWRTRNGFDPMRRHDDGESMTSSTSGFDARGNSMVPNYEVGSAFDLESIPGFDRDAPSSLVNLCLRAVARNWAFHVVYDKYYLRELRAPYKSLLLAHLAAFTISKRQQSIDEDEIRPGSITKQSFELLFRASFPDDSGERDPEFAEEIDSNLGMAGTDLITHLNFAGSIGYSISMKDLIRLLSQRVNATIIATKTTDTLLLSTKAAQKQPAVLDSWEDFDQEDDVVVNVAASSSNINIRHFTNLTHLSLAYPNSSVSFADLVKLTRDATPTITHLSIAGWKTPESGPDSLAVKERVGLNLKALSKNLICLRYLDVSDCDTNMYKGLEAVDWAGCWRKVDDLIARQGLALSARGIRVLSSRFSAVQDLETAVKTIRKDAKAEHCRFIHNYNDEGDDEL